MDPPTVALERLAPRPLTSVGVEQGRADDPGRAAAHDDDHLVVRRIGAEVPAVPDLRGRAEVRPCLLGRVEEPGVERTPPLVLERSGRAAGVVIVPHSLIGIAAGPGGAAT